MSIPGSIPNDPTARLVRAALEHDASVVDIVRMQSRIRAKLAAQGQDPSRFRSANVPGGVLPLAAKRAVLAATLLVVAGIAVYLSVSPAPVQAYSLLQSARAALAENVDREYEITFEPDAGLPMLNSLDSARLWTRGDRFRVEFVRGNHHVLWGKDDQQQLWVLCSENKALSFESNEIPAEVAALLSYLSLDVKHVTDQILHNCEVTFSEGMQNQSKRIKTLAAKPKNAGHSVEFSAAQIDIDESTLAIRRLELTRRVNDAERGRCQFVLVSEASQPDASYRLESYLAENAKVLKKSKYHDRMIELFRTIRELAE
jgi:hypothetical protein